MAIHLDIQTWFWANQYLLLPLNAVYLTEKAADNNLIVQKMYLVGPDLIFLIRAIDVVGN
jgi:hypothetical protein